MRRALPFGFGRQPRAAPAREGARFRVAHVDGPRERQRNIVEHRAQTPALRTAMPEHRMLDAFGLAPGPVGLGPEVAAAISAIVHEIEKRVVRDHIAVDLERGHIHLLLAEFVVPAEQAAFERHAQFGAAGRHAHHLRRHRVKVIRERTRGARRLLLLERQLMEHVGERLHMHQTMLDRDVQQLPRRVVHGGAGRQIEPGEARVDTRTGVACVVAHGVETRPVRGDIGRQRAIDGIDAEGEQLVELRVGGRQIEQALIEQIAVERFQMTDIEHDAMALANRAFVEKFGLDEGEERVAGRTGVGEAGGQRGRDRELHCGESPGVGGE
ncbi:hypothetical protein PT2222_150196 [Paraburkholderia tropica]